MTKKQFKKTIVFEKLKSIFLIALTFLFAASYFYYYLAYKNNEATDQQVTEYINDSHMVKLNNIKSLNFAINQYTHFFSIASYPKSRLTLLIKPQGDKYFIIEDFDHKQSPVSGAAIKGRSINARINNKEYSDANYGTKNSPVPILYYNDANSPDDVYVTEGQYRKNVKEYLTYEKKVNSNK